MGKMKDYQEEVAEDSIDKQVEEEEEHERAKQIPDPDN